MDIQLISYETLNPSDYPGITLSPLECPKSLDEFDINVFDISAEGLWKYFGSNIISINSLADFKSINKMILSKKRAKIIFVLPQNIIYQYDGYREKGVTKYRSAIYLKNMLDRVSDIISYALPVENLFLNFENTRTNINDRIYEADFYFSVSAYCMTKSIRSEKATTIALGRDVYATTLRLGSSVGSLTNFVNTLFEINRKAEIPDWIEQCDFLDDALQREAIQKSHSIIENENCKILQAKSKLTENAKYKSILYTNGAELVEVIFDILEKLLDCDLSKFIDENKEDFLIQKPQCTFIGEIKGVTSNIKNEHISQVENHYQGYIDKLEESALEENVHQLLIMNPFRTKPINEREPVNEKQIALAKRNQCLIIETHILLCVFEKFCQSQITSEQCIEVFSNQIGLLQLRDFKNPTPEELESFKV